MTVKLNRSGYDHARKLVEDDLVVHDERDAWSEHQPTTERQNEFINANGWTEYGKWHLGVNDAAPHDTKAHYEFPYGDFRQVHRCAVLSAESRAGQYKHDDIEKAAHHLHEMIDAARV